MVHATFVYSSCRMVHARVLIVQYPLHSAGIFRDLWCRCRVLVMSSSCVIRVFGVCLLCMFSVVVKSSSCIGRAVLWILLF